MRILFLGPADSPLIPLFDDGDSITTTTEPLTTSLWYRINRVEPDWTVSYGYRHIIRGEVLERIRDRAINLHISMLPYNRGADPNLWSFVDHTPKGVSIHHIDDGIDTGDLIARRFVRPEPGDTLRTSYERLQAAVQELFYATWPLIRNGIARRYSQPLGGSYHTMADRERIVLPNGWDTPVIGLGSRERPLDFGERQASFAGGQ